MQYSEQCKRVISNSRALIEVSEDCPHKLKLGGKCFVDKVTCGLCDRREVKTDEK